MERNYGNKWYLGIKLLVLVIYWLSFLLALIGWFIYAFNENSYSQLFGIIDDSILIFDICCLTIYAIWLET